MQKHRHRRAAGPPPALRFLLFLLVAALLFLALRRANSRLRATAMAIASRRAEQIAVLAVNDCVQNLLSDPTLDYASLVSVEKTADGSVSVVRADISAINTLKARLTAAVQTELLDDGGRTVTIALGTLSGIDLLTDRGPAVPIKIIPIGNIQTEIYNEFTQAGINQTLHRMFLGVTATVSIVMAGSTGTGQVQTDFCIAETIIIGAVPEAYTEVNEAQDKISSIYDHGALQNWEPDN